MNKQTKIILIIVVIALLAFGIILAVYNYYKSEPMDANTTNEDILDDANKGLDNLINDILSENVENKTENKKSDNNTTNTETNSDVTNTSGTSSQNQNTSSQVSNQTTPGEQKAIELAKEEWKKEWGNLNDVSFNNVSVQGDGKYIVSVNDSKTTNVIRWYIVDTYTGLVTEK